MRTEIDADSGRLPRRHRCRGQFAVFRDAALAEVTLSGEQLTGHAPRAVPQWLEDNVALFRRA